MPRFIKHIGQYGRFLREFMDFKKLAAGKDSRFSISWSDRYACLADRTKSTAFDAHYVYHTAWAARVLSEIRPQKHVDISSSLYFSALVSAFVPVKFYDFRPADLRLSGLEMGAVDICSLPFPERSISSLSCMHVVEHIGLGRYGDQLDPAGDRKATSELARVLAPGGTLLFVVPVGRPRIMFNAHRIYSFDQVKDLFGELSLVEHALIPDVYAGVGIVPNASGDMINEQSYGCGCFRFERRNARSQKAVAN